MEKFVVMRKGRCVLMSKVSRGRALLRWFRFYQERQGNSGCLCNGCAEAMGKALRKFEESEK